jgi:hypothetical protein
MKAKNIYQKYRLNYPHEKQVFYFLLKQGALGN